MDKIIRVGDNVLWRGSWGSQPAKLAKVIGIEKTSRPREKYGYAVNEILVSDKECAVFTLDNNHWAYGHQIDDVQED